MKKISILLVIVFVIIMLSQPCLAKSIPQEYADFEYTNIDGKIIITDYFGTNTTVTVPATIDGCPVTTIASKAFAHSYFSSISLPSTIASIESNVFSCCPCLTHVVMNSSEPPSLGSFAFNTEQLAGDVTIFVPDGSISSYKNGDGSWQRSYADLLSPISEFNKNYQYIAKIQDDLVYHNNSFNTITIIGYVGDSAAVTIPSKIEGKNVSHIASEAFAHSYFSSISLPPTITSIESNVFSCCPCLTHVVMNSSEPPSLRSFAFNAEQLAGDVTIFVPDGSISSYKNGDGSWSRSYGELIQPISNNKNDLLYIAKSNGLFRYYIKENYACIIGCNSNHSTSLQIPDSIEGYPVRCIKQKAFYHDNLSVITIPSSVVEIEGNIFSCCYYLSEIRVCAKTPAELGSFALSSAQLNGDTVIRVPYFSVTAYQNKWRTYRGLIESEQYKQAGTFGNALSWVIYDNDIFELQGNIATEQAVLLTAFDRNGRFLSLNQVIPAETIDLQNDTKAYKYSLFLLEKDNFLPCCENLDIIK